MERARPLGIARGVLAGDAEGDERSDGSLERVGDREEAAGDRARHAPCAGDSCEQRVTVRDRSGAGPVRDVVDRPGDRCDHTERGRSGAGDRGRVVSRGDRLDAANLGLDPDERRHLPRVAAQHRHVDLVEDALRRLGAVRRRADSDRIEDEGTPASLAATPAISIASTQCGESVPMFSTSAPAMRTISATSSRACAITGSAPSASVAFAVSFMTT